MSAQAVLSMIAPALPNVPQGIAGDDVASGFESLLAGMMGASPKEAETATTPGDETKDGSDGAAVVMTGFLLAPTAAAVQAAQAPAGDASASGDEAVPSSQSAGETQPTDPDTAPAPRAETPAQPRTGDPQVQPPAIDKTARGKATTDGQAPSSTPDTADAEAAVAAAKLVQDVARIENADLKAAPPAAPASVASAPPVPLRPLAERTSRPLEAADGKSAVAAPDGAAPASVNGAPAPTAQTAPNDQPIKAVEATPAVGPDLTAAEGDNASSEVAPQADAGAATAQAAPVARDTHVSALSRAAVEATAQIAAQILKKLDGRSTRFEMALTPDDLGRVDVKLDIDSEGRLAARLAFDNPAAAADLKGRADELRRQLEQAGFHMADDAFEFAERDSGSSAFDRGQDDRGQGRAFAAASRLNAEADVVPPPRWTALTLSPSGVDMKV